jgi:chromosome segregation ATPase
MHKPLHVLTIIALLASATVYAQQADHNGMRYKWVDGKGLPHFSDSLSQDAIKYGYDVVNDQGMVVQRVQRQLSPEERAAAQKQAAQQAAAQRAAQDRARADEQMLSAYPDEAAYKAALQQALANMDQQIHTSRLNLRSQEQALTELLGRGAEFEHNKQSLPKSLQDGIAKQRGVVSDLQALLQRQQALREQAAQAQTQQLAHYRALQAEQDEQP